MLTLFLFFIVKIYCQQEDCELCKLIEYQNSYDNDPMFWNRTKFNWTTEALREKINKTIVNQLKIDIETIRENKDLAKLLPIDELKKAITIWNQMKISEQADKIRQIKVPSYIPVPVYSVYQIPILHHFPVEQIIRNYKPVPFGVPMENQILQYEHDITSKIPESLVKPSTVPFDVKVPIPVILPMDDEEFRKKSPPEIITNLRSQFDEIDSKTQVVHKKKNMISELKKQFLDLLNN